MMAKKKTPHFDQSEPHHQVRRSSRGGSVRLTYKAWNAEKPSATLPRTARRWQQGFSGPWTIVLAQAAVAAAATVVVLWQTRGKTGSK